MSYYQQNTVMEIGKLRCKCHEKYPNTKLTKLHLLGCEDYASTFKFPDDDVVNQLPLPLKMKR